MCSELKMDVLIIVEIKEKVRDISFHSGWLVGS